MRSTRTTGQIVTTDGYTVALNITIPVGSKELTISRSGEDRGAAGDDGAHHAFGQLQIADFVNEAGLKPLGDNLFQETPASASWSSVRPTIRYGYLKQSYPNRPTSIR